MAKPSPEKDFPKVIKLGQTPSIESFSPGNSHYTQVKIEQNNMKGNNRLGYLECTQVYVSLSLRNVG